MESMTPATCGLTSPRQFAEYDPDTSCWRTWPATGLWGSTSYLGTWPRSGMTCGGRAYELRTSVHHTAGNGSSSLLKTPTAQLAINGGSQHPDKRKEGGHGPTLADQVEHTLLPTPKASNNENASSAWANGPNLGEALALLPTPTATPYGNNQSPSPAAAVRPSLDYLIPLLPTPQATDGTGGPKRLRADGRTETDHGANLRDLFSGASTSPRSDGGNDSPE